jgi:hypothetical protein
MRKGSVHHPLLFAAYPVLAIHAHNDAAPPLSEVGFALAVVLGAVLLLWLVLLALARSVRRSAIAATLFAVLFFSYGHLLQGLEAVSGAAPGPEWRAALLAAMAVAFGALVAWSIRSRRDVVGLTVFLNATGWALMLVVLAQLAVRLPASLGEKAPDRDPAILRTRAPGAGPASGKPDIYYIVLDGYARHDILHELFGHDNEPFLQYLESRGFVVARRSTANYSQTNFSLASSLNLNYLDHFVRLYGARAFHPYPSERFFKNNLVGRFLKQQGYQVVSFDSGYGPTEQIESDVPLRAARGLSELENVLIGTTPLPLLLRHTSGGSQHERHRARILSALQRLPDVADIAAPTFTFLHIVAPHPPFVFDEAGNVPADEPEHYVLNDGDRYMRTAEDRARYLRLYPAGVRFLNRLLETAIDALLARCDEPPIIVLQSDHGSGFTMEYGSVGKTNLRERMSILNAYLLPGDAGRLLYDSISPVNTFRLILGHQFGAQLPLLPDESYFSPYDRAYDLIRVTEQVR